jgi:DNA-directed RNA polymerase specialized sigma24 family protein
VTPSLTPKNPIDLLVQSYGDLLFDLCESVLWSPETAQFTFRAILKTLRKDKESHGFVDHQRSWVLQVTCEKLLEASSRHARRLTPSEQIELDSAQGVTTRLKQFNSYFHRLGAEDQILLLLRDKYGLPYPEIASALGMPEATLKIRRAQALRSLEEWVWDSK